MNALSKIWKQCHEEKEPKRMLKSQGHSSIQVEDSIQSQSCVGSIIQMRLIIYVLHLLYIILDSVLISTLKAHAV